MADDQNRLDGEAEEIHDILIAISVTAKRLAKKLESKSQQRQEDPYGESEGTGHGT